MGKGESDLRAKAAVVLSLCVLGSGTLLHAQQGDNAPKVYAETSKSVFILVVKSERGDIVGQGTGFLVRGGIFVTNEHLVRNGRVYVELGAARVPAKVERVDVLNDLAVVSVSGELSVKPLTIAESVPAPGTSVYAIGNPAGLERSISTGVVSGVRESAGRQLLQVTSPISPGSSGGPILNSRGEVVGVAVGFLEGGQNLNFAVPATIVARLLRGEASSNLDAASLLGRVEILAERQASYEYSWEPESDWQRANREIDTTLQSALELAGNDIGLILRIAEKAQGQNTEIAVAAAERAVRVKPTAEGQLALGKALQMKSYSSDEEDQRKTLLERAERAVFSALTATKQPTAEMLYLLADILEDRGNYVAAEANFRRVLDLSKTRSDTVMRASCLRGLVRVASSLGKRPDVDTWFNALVEMGSANALDWQRQGERLARASSWRDAGQAYRQAALLKGAWTNWCEAAVSFSFTPGEEDSVLACARNCIDLGIGKKGSEGRLALAHRWIAGVLNQRGVYQEALSHAKEASTLSPSDAWAFSFQAEALLGLRRFQEAIRVSNEAIRLSDGKYGTMHFTLGLAYFNVENYELARQSFEKAAQLDPKDEAAAYNVAVCLQRLGFYLDAAKWYEEVLSRNPTRSDRQEILRQIQILRR